MYFVKPLALVFLVATVSAAPYDNAMIEVRPPYANKTIFGRAPFANKTIEEREPYFNTVIQPRSPPTNITIEARASASNQTSNTTAPMRPLITPAARRNFIPMYRRQVPTASSLCVDVGLIKGCVDKDGKGTGDLPAAVSGISVITSVVSKVTSLASSLPTPLAVPPKVPVPSMSANPFPAVGIPLPKASLPTALPAAAAQPKGVVPPFPKASVPARRLF